MLEILSKQRKHCDVLIDGSYRTVLAIQTALPKAKCFKFINNMTLFVGLCADKFEENYFSHMHYKQFHGLDTITAALNHLRRHKSKLTANSNDVTTGADNDKSKKYCEGSPCCY